MTRKSQSSPSHMTTRVDIKPELLRWACQRAGLAVDAITKAFPKLPAWVDGKAKPTLKQLEAFAKTTRTPIGYLLLPAPPVERIPIADLRTIRDAEVRQPSPDLLDTIHLCQQRQAWYRDFASTGGESTRGFVGSAQLGDEIVATAATMRQMLGFDLEERRRIPTWTEALRRFIDHADRLGVLVMVSGVVGSNNRRVLDPEEFRGFALSDELAPLVFINGADTKAAQMFTLAHELAHLWLGETALSNVSPASAPTRKIESWCNRVAAELLLPLAALEQTYDRDAELTHELGRLARMFKVSTLVVLRRIHDAGYLGRDPFWQAYHQEVERLANVPKSSGGNFYLTQPVRVSKRFARAMIVSTWEGRSSFTEAFRLLGIKRIETFRGLSESLDMVV